MNMINSIILGLSIVVFGFFAGRGLENFNRNERSISVRGLAEREVQSNIGVWKISFNVSSEKIEDVRKSLPSVQEEIQKFLTEQGFAPNEISRSSSVKDRQAQEYGAEKGNRFVASGQFLIKAQDVAKIEKASQQVDELLKKGIVITNSQINYFFTDLNTIKPEMLDEATKNAKEAALGFAKSMNVGVGKMKSASQGIFSIENPIGNEGSYGGESSSSITKKVRVVTQVEFYVD